MALCFVDGKPLQGTGTVPASQTVTGLGTAATGNGYTWPVLR